jgi:hypothetical protein
MSQKLRQQRGLIAAVAANLLGQALLLGALALAGEWRVWRCLTDFTLELDAMLLLGWFALKLRNASPHEGSL